MLGRDVPLERVRELLAEREAAYADADATIDTDGMRAGQAASAIVAAWKRLSGAGEDPP